MFATARALVVASMREKEPLASPARVREGLFLRFYGADFASSVGDTPLRDRLEVALDGR